MMSDMDRRIVAAVIAGTVLGWFVAAFVFYPPHAHWNDGLEIGDVATWVAAFATLAAVVVALNVSNRAIEAERELRRDDAKRAEDARHLQRGIMAGLCQVQLFNLIADCKRASLILRNHAFSTLDAIRALEMLGVKQLERACERLDLFERGDGIELGRVTLITCEMIESTKNQHDLLVAMQGFERDEEREFLAQTCVEVIKLATPLYEYFLQLAQLSMPTVQPEAHGQSNYDRLIELRRTL